MILGRERPRSATTAPSGPLRTAALLATTLLAVAAGTAGADAPRGVFARGGDRLTTEVGPAGDADVFTVELAEGGRLDVDVKAAKGATLLPTLRVLAPDGSEVTPSAGIKGLGRSRVKLKKLVAPAGATGVWQVVVAGSGDTTGEYAVGFGVAQPTRTRVKDLAIPAGAEALVALAAETGATVTVTIRAKGDAPLAGAYLVDPSGAEVPGSRDAFTAKGAKLRLAGANGEGGFPVAAGFGHYGVVLAGGTAPATAKVQVKVKPPKHPARKVTRKDESGRLPPELVASGVTSGDVRQEDVGTRVEVVGVGFLPGTTAAVTGDGVGVGAVTTLDATKLAVDVDVDADAPYGPRDVVVVPPPLLGEPQTIVGAIRVLAPPPTLVVASAPVVEQGDVAATVVLAGTGFRPGGSVTVDGAGVVVASVSVDSPEQLTLLLDVDIAAALGPRDVTYAQPAAGGGAEVLAEGAITVHAPRPSVSAIAPATVTQGDTNVLLTLTGEHFRDGGSVALGGSGLTVTEYVRVSDTGATIRVDVDDDASLGPQGVTYTQPAAGGGAAGTLDAALQVDAPAPAASAISVGSVKQDDRGVEIVLTGGGLRPGGTVSVSGSGVTVVSTTVLSRTSARATVDVAELAPLGLRDVTFTQPVVGGGLAVTLTDALTVLHPDPTLTGLASVGVRRGKSGTLRVFGTGFRDGGSVATTGTGVTLGTPTIVSGTVLDLPYQTAADAPLTSRDLTYTQPAAGGGAAVTLTSAYGVFSSPPTFTSIEPGGLRPGDVFVPCVITGTDLEAGTAVSFTAPGVTVSEVAFVSTTRIDVVVSVASTTPLGATGLVLQPPLGPPETYDDAFLVMAADATITGFSHAALARGADDVAVEVRGTSFVAGDSLSASGGGVTFANVAVQSSTLITADVDVAGGATLGARSLTVQHAAGVGGRATSRAGAFEVVLAGPTVTAIAPVRVATTPQGGVTRFVTAYVTGTGFASGAAVDVSRSGGSGVDVVSDGVRVLSGTEIEVRLSVAGGATAGTWDVTVTNPGGLGGSGTSGDDLLDVVDETTLVVNQVVPPAGPTYGGNRVVVHGGGFVLGSVVDFGGERALLAQVIDENTIVCTVPQPSAASRTVPTAVDVSVTPPSSSSASRPSGYAYARDTQTLHVVAPFPAHGATGVPDSQRACCLLLSAPSGTLPPYSGSSPLFPTGAVHWSVGAAGTAALGPNGRWLVYARSTTSALASGTYVMNAPTALVSLSGRRLVPVRRPDDGYDDFTYQVASGAGDTTAPTVASSTPAASASNVSTTAPITLVMSEEIDPTTIDATTVTLRRGATPLGVHVAVGADLRTLTLSPHAELATSSGHVVTVTTGVTDLHGNPVASTITRSFSTSSGTDTTPPTIDAVVLEGLPASVDGSGTYVSGADSTGSSANSQAASPGATVGYDLLLPPTDFELRVEFSDDGGVGVDESSFSATCSAAIGSTSAGTELASLFDVSSARAVWRVPATTPISAGENVTFAFSIGDYASNTSAAHTITVDVAPRTTGSASSTGGDLDPLGARQTWVIRSDLDAYTSSYSTQSGAPTQLMTSTSSSNGVADVDEALRLVGLWSTSPTAAAVTTTNGPSVGTNQIVRRLVLERIRELLRERFGIDADGTRDADAPEIEFLLQGEQGSLSALPSHSSTSSTASAGAFSEISVCGTQGAESDGAATTGVDGAAPFDVRNLQQEALVNTDGAYGVFLTSMLKSRLGDAQTASGNPYPFAARVLLPLCAAYGGTPVGEHASDDDVLAGSFDRSASASSTHNDRYDEVFEAIETVALFCTSTLAHEIGRATGLVPDGGPRTGLFGHAHRSNVFTDATSTTLNVSNHVRWAGMNNLMAPDGTFHEKIRTGSDFRRFNPLALAWLRRRVLHDEGQ